MALRSSVLRRTSPSCASTTPLLLFLILPLTDLGVCPVVELRAGQGGLTLGAYRY